MMEVLSFNMNFVMHFAHHKVSEHRSVESESLGSVPHGNSEFFLCPTFVTRRRKIFL